MDETTEDAFLESTPVENALRELAAIRVERYLYRAGDFVP
jgi:hypothetical protein